MTPPRKLITIGTVVKPHGFKGSLVAKTTTGTDSALSYLENVYIGQTIDENSQHRILEASWMPKGWKLTLEGLESEEAVNEIRGFSIFAERADLKEPASDSFYVSDLIGFEVIEDQTQKTIGKLKGIEQAHAQSVPGQDIWQVLSPEGALDIPANKHFIKKVDTPGRRIIVQNLKELKTDGNR